MTQYSTLIFDLDGTLTDPGLGVVRCMNFALTSFDYSPLPDAEIKRYIGPPLEQTLGILADTEDQQHIDALAHAYRERYGEFGYKENTVYDGIPEMLTALQSGGVRLAVCTSKLEINAIRVLEEFNLLQFFEVVNGNKSSGPKSGQLAILLQEGVIDGNALMIGDRNVDLRAAHANQLASAGVLWGYGDAAELQAESPSLLFNSPNEITQRFV